MKIIKLIVIRVFLILIFSLGFVEASNYFPSTIIMPGDMTNNYMTFDIRSSKANMVEWNIEDADAEGVEIFASTSTEYIFGRYIE